MTIKYEMEGYDHITPCPFEPKLEAGIVIKNVMVGAGICSKYCLNHSFTDATAQTVICKYSEAKKVSWEYGT